MASCPKCGRKLHIYNWKQECPYCHVNMIYYKSNDRLLEETEQAEIEFAKLQPKIDRAKSATIGQKKGIIRMIFFLIPAVALFLPIFSITVYGVKTNYNIIGLYRIISSLDIGKLIPDILPIVVGMVLCALTVLLGLVFLILQVTSGTKKGLTRNIIYSCISLITAIASIICIIRFTDCPAVDYSKILLNEAEYICENGSQEEVDGAVKKIKNFFNDKTVDTGILKKAVRNGAAALADSENRGYIEEQITALKNALEEAEKILNNGETAIDDIREAAQKVNSAVASYNDLETAVRYASLVKNDGSISEKSFDLEPTLKECEKMLVKLANGETIVETKDNRNRQKTEEDIKKATEKKLKNAADEINDKLTSFVDISVISRLNGSLFEAVNSGTAKNAEVIVSFGAGMILFIILITAQLVFNITIKKIGYEIKYTQCFIGGIPSGEYFSLKEQGEDELVIRRKMLDALKKMQAENRAREAKANEEKEAERAAWK